MSIEKSDKNFYELTKHYLSNSSDTNLYPIMFDSSNNEYFMNIFRAYIINNDVQNNVLFYSTYEVSDSDWFDTISNKYYETSYLWWLIPLMNNMHNPFEGLNPGDNLKILKRDYVYQLLKEVGMVASL
jgi:hypothetical protein